MTKSSLFVIFLLTIVAILLGYNYVFKPFADLGGLAQIEASPEPSPEPQSGPVETAIEQLSDKEKVMQLIAGPLVIDGGFDSEAETTAWLSRNNTGFLTYFGSNISTASARQANNYFLETATVNQVPPPLFVVDHEGGTVQRLSGSGFTTLPSWEAMCEEGLVLDEVAEGGSPATTLDQPASAPSAQDASASAQVATSRDLVTENRELLKQSAQELKQAGISVVFAPVVDIDTPSSALGSRVCSDDPATIVRQAAELIAIYGQQQILPVIKHFPGIGQVDTDLHNEFDVVEVGPSQAFVYQGLLGEFPNLGVMVAHVGVLNQYPDVPCSLSEDCVGELSTNFPQALIFSDALDMESAGYVGEFKDSDDGEVDITERAIKAVEAGNNVLVFGAQVDSQNLESVVESLTKKYQAEASFKEKVDASLRKIIEFKVSQSGREL